MLTFHLMLGDIFVRLKIYNQKGEQFSMRKVINIFAVLLIIFIATCVFGFVPIDVKDYEVPLLAIIGAVALVNVSISVKTYLVKPGRYTPDPDMFVDRKSQINNILNMTRKGRSIVNVFGITGIGVTRLQQFTADLINKKIPFMKRRRYCKNLIVLFNLSYKGYYINVTTVNDLRDVVNMLYTTVLVDEKSTTTISGMCKAFNRKLKSKKLVIFFDGINNWEQMMLLEELALQYFPLRPKDSFVFGTHQKSLSYQYNYDYIEILKFNKEDMMILIEAHKVKSDEKFNLQLYEITDGIPLFAYLLLKDVKARELVNNNDLKDIYAYLRQFVAPSLLNTERDILEKLSLLSLSVAEIGKNELELIGLPNSYDIIDILNYKGLLNFCKIKNKIAIPRAIAKSFLAYSFNQEELCLQLYQYYRQLNKKQFAVLYLLLSKHYDGNKERFIETNIQAWINNQEILSMLTALSPSIEFRSNVKSKYSKTYVTYIYACIYMYSVCGEYPKAKNLLDKLIVDGKIIQRYDAKLNDENFNLHFLWADVEHLLNNYDSAIHIIDSLISNSQQYKESLRFPQLYWMRAHCMRHQAKDLQQSFCTYELCEEKAIKQNNTEYIIRSLHGQICISLILSNAEFDYISTFNRLHEIYEKEAEQWNAYKYNTFKYESIYKRIYNSDFLPKLSPLTLLEKAKEGFISIKKRNIYDVDFEMGEYYRYHAMYAESIEHYTLCMEFAQCNSDYNLESLSRLGLILANIANGNTCKPENLLSIIKEAQQKNLNLSVSYAYMILEHLKKVDFDFFLPLFNP